MPTQEWVIQAGADDGGYYDANFGNTQTYVYFIHHVNYYHDFFRFAGMTIPRNSTIGSAYWKWKCASGTGWGGGIAEIQAFDEGNSSQIADIADYEARAQTTAAVDYNPGRTVQNNWYESPDIKDVIQEIVNRGDWSNGNALQLAIETTLLAGDSGRRKAAYCLESGDATKLEVTWTPPPVPPPAKPLICKPLVNPVIVSTPIMRQVNPFSNRFPKFAPRLIA